MAFNEIELRYLKNTVGKMCDRRSPVYLRDQLRTVFETKGHDVIIFEERPVWNDPQSWTSLPVAKFKYIRKDNIWKLYWMRRDLKWHSYQLPRSRKTLETLVEEVDRDPYGAFWG